MKDYKTQPGFWKAFQKAVPNFDETKLWLEKKSGNLFICFVESGKLRRCKIYKSDYYINLWKQHFIEFLETGIFDWNVYHILYEKKDINPKDIGKVWQHPLISKYGYDTYEYSEESSKFLENYRKKYKNCGMKTVGKPSDWKGEGVYNIEENLY